MSAFGAKAQDRNRPIADIAQTDNLVANSSSEGDAAHMLRATKDRFRVSQGLVETSAQLASLKTNSFRQKRCPSRSSEQQSHRFHFDPSRSLG